MRIGVPRETWPGERRAALVPLAVKKLVGAGFEVVVETSAWALRRATRTLPTSRGRPNEPRPRGACCVKPTSCCGCASPTPRRSPAEGRRLHVSFLDPFNEKALVAQLAAQGVTAISMEMIPRTTRAQKMDALSSQANLAGYVTVIQAAYHSRRSCR
jgi:H+-translocating NAD(P) transhydrogenase subunit alpha